MDGKKISFGFAKVSKKQPLQAGPAATVPIKNKDDSIQMIECLEGQSIKVIGGSEEPPAPLVIPLREQDKTTVPDRLAKLLSFRMEKLGRLPEVESKQPPADSNTNGSANSDAGGVESKVEPNADVVVVRADESLEQRAAREILNDISQAKVNHEEQHNFVVPLLPEDLPLDGARESTMDDYESVPIEKFGLAMLRGMGFKDDPKKDAAKPDGPDFGPVMRPKGLGLGADRAMKAKAANAPLIPPAQGEVLTMKRGAQIKVLAGKHKDAYGTARTATRGTKYRRKRPHENKERMPASAGCQGTIVGVNSARCFGIPVDSGGEDPRMILGKEVDNVVQMTACDIPVKSEICINFVAGKDPLNTSRGNNVPSLGIPEDDREQIKSTNAIRVINAPSLGLPEDSREQMKTSKVTGESGDKVQFINVDCIVDNDAFANDCSHPTTGIPLGKINSINAGLTLNSTKVVVGVNNARSFGIPASSGEDSDHEVGVEDSKVPTHGSADDARNEAWSIDILKNYGEQARTSNITGESSGKEKTTNIFHVENDAFVKDYSQVKVSSALQNRKGINNESQITTAKLIVGVNNARSFGIPEYSEEEDSDHESDVEDFEAPMHGSMVGGKKEFGHHNKNVRCLTLPEKYARTKQITNKEELTNLKRKLAVNKSSLQHQKESTKIKDHRGGIDTLAIVSSKLSKFNTTMKRTMVKKQE